MKKFVYLCGMMLLCMNMMAQIDPNDDNWECFINEDFSIARTWSNNHWQDSCIGLGHQSLWRCFGHELWPSGVTSANHHCQAYRPQNAVFSTDHTMKLIGEFKTARSMWCDVHYKPAPDPYHCNTPLNQHQNIHYYGGMIETIDSVGYGYYEIECKMPIHDGASTSFWFWSCKGGTYNEIDVLEHCTGHCQGDMARTILSGIWYNPSGTNLQSYYDTIVQATIPGAQRYAENRFTLPSSSQALNAYHTFGCLWMPERMAVFCDGELVTECTDPDHIPPHSMWLKITHKEDEDAWTSMSRFWWNTNDTVTINYVKAYRLKTDCNTDAVIRNTTDFSNYNYSVKHSITMGATTGVLSIPNNIEFTMRAVDSIVIDSGFEVPTGTGMTLITQECPYCSDN